MKSVVRVIWILVALTVIANMVALVMVYQRGNPGDLGDALDVFGEGAASDGLFGVSVLAAVMLGVAGLALRRDHRAEPRTASVWPTSDLEPGSTQWVRNTLRELARTLRPAAEAAEPDAVTFLGELLNGAIKLGAIAPGQAWVGGSHVDNERNLYRSPAGNQSRPVEVSHQPVASFAWSGSDLGCEA